MDIPISQAERDEKAYALAHEYLLGLDGVTQAMIDRHVFPSANTRPDSPAGIYKHLLATAQNANMGPNVITGSMGSIDRLGVTLCDFEPTAVVEKYRDSGWEAVLHDIVTEVKPRGKIRRTSRSLWPRLCRTVISGAQFLARFSDADDFYRWADVFDRDDRTRPALPMLLSYEIVGFGFPLACDFLKEMGYWDFGKPDVHLKKIFTALGLSPTGHDYQVFKAIVRVARNVGVRAYAVDKLFWLVGSGYFYLDDIKIGGHREDFIRYATERLG